MIPGKLRWAHVVCSLEEVMFKQSTRPVTLNALITKMETNGVDALLVERITHAYFCAERLYRDAENVAGVSKLKHGLLSAETVYDLGQDADTIIAAILNHVESPEEIAQVEAEFGFEVGILLKALRKLDIYTRASRKDTQRTLEAIRRAAFSIIEGDVRVVIIRLSMALHTLRASKDIAFDTRSLIAHDALYIYAPLANRLGIWTVKWELEDLAFRYLQPLQYKAIAKSLDERREDRDNRIERAKEQLREALEGEALTAEVTGRPKHIYSIYRKMERKGVAFDGIYDAHALRVIIDDVEGEETQAGYARCYRVLGLVHSLWSAIPEEYDDYIQNPKPNGYRSLHTAVHDSDGKILEIQVRTRRMHNEAEQGFAAHWAYKEGGKPSAHMLRQIESMRRTLNDIGDSAEKIPQFDPSKQQISAEPAPTEGGRVYVFTPGGDLFDLQKGSTPIDFAYAIHTNVGHRTRGAKVNDRMVPLDYTLRSGDHVEIITFGKKDDDFAIGKPSRDWMSPSAGYAVSSKTRNRVRAWFRKHEREQNIEFGRQHLERELKRLSVSNGTTSGITQEALAEHLGEPVDEMLSLIGFGDITTAQIEGAVALILRDRRQDEVDVPLDERDDENVFNVPLRAYQSKPSKGLTVMGMAGLHTKMAGCCNPIPPEPILGYVTRGNGVTIHNATCAQVSSRREAEPERVVEADWGLDKGQEGTYQIPFRLKAYRTAGLLEKIASVLSGQNINLLKTKSAPMRDRDQISIFILAEVRNLDQANWIEDKLTGLKNVFEVAR